MKNRILLSALSTLAMTQAATAHPGGHDHMTADHMAVHLWTSPFHVTLMGLACLGVAACGIALYRARSEKKRKSEAVSMVEPKERDNG